MGPLSPKHGSPWSTWSRYMTEYYMRNSRVVEKYVRVVQGMNKDSPEPLLVCNRDDEWVRESPKL